MANSTGRAVRLLWQELAEEQQLAVLVRLIRTRRKRYEREFQELLSLGHGYKRVLGERTSERCLAFLVKKKSERAKKFPRFVSTIVVQENKRRLVEVPTDVEQVGGGKPQVGVNAADGVYVASSQYPQLNATGAICCLVRVAGRQDLYALSCNHVLTLSSLIANGGVAQDAIVAARTPHIPFGQLATYSPLAPNQTNQIDAALALVDSATQWNYNGAQPIQVEMGLVEPQGCGVFTPRGLQPATWVKTFYDLALSYPTVSPIRIAAAYQFEAATLPGDSGSAVMDNSRRLYAMHFWGDPSQNMSLAIPAGYLFRPGTFGDFNLRLA